MHMRNRGLFCREKDVVLHSVRSMIDEREVSERLHDAMVVPVERIFAGNGRIDEFELEPEVALRQGK